MNRGQEVHPDKQEQVVEVSIESVPTANTQERLRRAIQIILRAAERGKEQQTNPHPEEWEAGNAK